MKGSVTQTVAYRAQSRVVGDRYVLETAGGRCVRQQVSHPVFFDGFLTESVQSALGLGAVARIARTRYHDPSLTNQLRDPVVTCNGDRVRFESFSGCAGVYARLDVLNGGLDGQVHDRGTTNVDFNQPFTDALARVAPADPLRLRIGPDEVTLETFDDHVVEQRVELPRRWLRGFAEVSALMPDWKPRAELSGPEARRFLRSLPRGGERLWAVPAGRTLRLTTTPGPGAVCVAGPQRLAELSPLLRFATGLRIHGPEVDGRALPEPSAWELSLRHARFVLVLSPERHRGLSGEGAVLDALTGDRVAEDAELLAERLEFDARIDVAALAGRTGLSEVTVRSALVHLATSGRVGYDLAEAAYFHRELPYDRDNVEALNPRLSRARDLVAQRRVRRTPEGFAVDVVEYVHHVRLTPTISCTCRWWARYGAGRGPCAHVLAATTVGTSE